MQVLLRTVTLFLIVAAFGCAEVGGEAPAAEETADEAGYLEELKRFYDQAMEEAPDNPVDWAKEDIGKIGDWEYKIVELDKGDNAEIEAQLNALGAERWEVYWVSESLTTITFYLKKSSRSYLRLVPLSGISKVFTGSDGGAE